MNKIEQMVKEMCPEGVKIVKLKNVARLSRGKVISKMYITDNPGIYPVYSSQTANNGVLGTIGTFMFDGVFLTWTTDGANAGTVFRRKGKFNITNVCGLIDVISVQANINYLYYWLQIEAPKHVNQGMGNPKLMSNVMEEIDVPLPPLPIQEAIVEILDKFESLQQGLQDELQARKSQYEYYRNKLLTQFPDNVQVKEYTLGELGTIKRGNGLQKRDFVESGVGCIHYGQIYTRLNSFTNTTLTFVTPAMYKSQNGMCIF